MKPVTGIVLNGTDREICELAARVLMALDSGAKREEAIDQMVQCYRDDLSDAHSAVDPDLLDDMTVGFGAALLLAMERLNNDSHERGLGFPARGIPQGRRRVLEALSGYLWTVDPRH